MRLFAYAALLFALSSCATARFSLPVEAPRLSTSERERQLAPLTVLPDPFSLQCAISIANADGSRSELRGVMLFDTAHDRLRFELYPTAGAYALGAVVVNGERLTAFDAGTKRGIITDRSSGLVKYLLGIALRPQELGTLLIGRIPGSIQSELRSAVLEDEGALVALTADRRTLLTVQHSRLVEYSYRARGTAGKVRFEYGSSESPIPTRITVQDAVTKQEITLAVTAYRPLTAAAANRFELKIPSGYDVHHQFD